MLARFEAPAGQPGSITVLARKAQAFKQTLLQVGHQCSSEALLLASEDLNPISLSVLQSMPILH